MYPSSTMTNTGPGEYFEYRISAKFVGELQIVISVLVIVAGTVCLVSHLDSLKDSVGHERDIAIGYITYSGTAVVIGVADIVFASILISGTNRISLERCLTWRGFSLMILLVYGLLTISFAIMIQAYTVILGFIPTLVFKPFAMWIVQGFVDELRQLDNFPTALGISQPSDMLKLSPSSSNSRRYLRRRPPEFLPHRKSSLSKNKLPSIITSKITPIPEEPETDMAAAAGPTNNGKISDCPTNTIIATTSSKVAN